MATLSKLKPGQILWTVTRHKMGNTMVSTVSIHPVRVIQVSDRAVFASWNGNNPQNFYERDVKRWKLKEPVTVPTWNGYGARLATREEIKAQRVKDAHNRVTGGASPR